MRNNDSAVLFHNLLSTASSIRDIFHFLSTKNPSSADEETKNYLQEGLKRSERLIKQLQEVGPRVNFGNSQNKQSRKNQRPA